MKTEMTVTETTYAEMVNALVKDPREILRDLQPDAVNLLHMAVGISDEAGEVLGLVKKVVINGGVYNRKELVKELGDIEFYLEGLRQETGITRKEVLLANIEKLADRYTGFVYSDEASRRRKDVK